MNFDRARSPLDCGNDDIDAEFGRNADAVDVLLGGTTAQTTADNDEQINLWDYGATGDIVDADLGETITEFLPSNGDNDDGNSKKQWGQHRQQQMKIQNRLPYFDNNLFILGHRYEVCQVGNKGVVAVTRSGLHKTTVRLREMRSLKSLRWQIDLADALVQSWVPSYIEFQEKVWHPKLLLLPLFPVVRYNVVVLTPTGDQVLLRKCTTVIDY